MDAEVADLWQLVGKSLAAVVGAAPESHTELFPDAWMVLSGEPIMALNCAYIHAGPGARDRLSRFCDEARGRVLPLKLYVSGEAASQLGPELARMTDQSTSDSPLMVALSSAIGGDRARDSFEIEAVTDMHEMNDVNRLLSEVFQLPLETMQRLAGAAVLRHPDITYLAAKSNGTLCSAMTAIRHGRTVGIWNMATAPEMRRQGGAKALLSVAMAQECERGAERFFLLASRDGKPLYERLGFATADTATIFRFPVAP